MTKVHDYFDKYTFLCEMYKEEADVILTLILHFFPFDNSVQVIDSEKGKNLVKRSHAPLLRREMLQVGNMINVFSKLLYIKDCAPLTRDTLFYNSETTFVLIKPCDPILHGKIIQYIMLKGFRIIKLKNAKIDKDFAMDMYKNIPTMKSMPLIVDYLTSGEVVGLELVRTDAISYFRQCLGETDPAEAAPGTLRQLFGQNVIRNVAHSCIDREDVDRVTELFFGNVNGIPRVPYQATMTDCTCCVILPHVVVDGNVGAILEHVTASGRFRVTCFAMFTVTLPCAQEFYEIYKTVLPEYDKMCFHLAEGKSIALEVKSTDPSVEVVSEFRKLCGPRDPDICRQLYPDTIRALYGKDSVANAVHCTDLPEDGPLEVEYMFKLLTQQTNKHA